MKKRKRAQEEKKKQQSPESKISTIRCSLKGIISPFATPDPFLEVIERLVLTLGRLRHEASILANYILLKQCEEESFTVHLGDEKRWIQFFRACLTKIKGGTSGAIELSNHRKTKAQMEAIVDPEKKGIQQWQDELHLLSLQPTEFNEDVEWTKLMLEHPCEREALILQEQKCHEEVKSKFQDEERRLASTKYINELPWPTSNYPYKMQLKGFASSIDVLAKEMATNALTSLSVNFERRQMKVFKLLYPEYLARKVCVLINCRLSDQKSLLDIWCKLAEETHGDSKETVLSKSSRRSFLYQLQSAHVTSMIQEHRELIRSNKLLEDTRIDAVYIAKHSETVICYNRHLLRMLHNIKEDKRVVGKKMGSTFHLLPLHHYKRFFIQLQPKLMREISRTLDKKMSNKSDPYQHWFDFSHLKTQPNMVFDDHIKTDGVTACVAFSRETKKTKGYKPRKFVKPKASVKRLKVLESTATSRKPINPRLNGIHIDKSSSLDPELLAHVRLLGVDPGNQDIVTVYDSSIKDINNPFRKMSKGEYYHHRKTRVFARRREYHWKLFVAEHQELSTVSEHCFREHESASFLAAWCERLKIEDLLWNFYSLRMHSKWRAESRKAQQRTDVLIAQRILGTSALDKKSTVPVVIAYGNGKFPTAVRGHAATPLQRIPKNLSHHACVVMTDEYNTSKVCPDCKEKTLRKHVMPCWEKTSAIPMAKKSVGTHRKYIFKLRPVYKCVTKACFRVLACAKHCSNTWIKPRDWVGACNIAEVCLEELIHHQRPSVFARAMSAAPNTKTVELKGPQA
jgi:hypothetical protein